MKNFSWLVWEKVPLFALSGASAIVTLLAHIRGAVRPLPLSLRLANAIISYVRYVKLALWPSHLAVYYPHQLISLRNWNVVADFLFLALVTWLVMVERRRRYLFVGWFWFFVTLLPMIGIVQVGTQGMANRYGYLSLIGIFIMAGWGAADAFEHLRIPIVLQTGAATIVLAALLITTHRELQYWSDSVTLWTHTLAVTRDNAIAEVDLGAALLQQGEVGRAMEHFRAATMIDPLDPLANMYIGRYAQTQNNPTVAIAAYKKVVQSSKDPGLKARALSNMGNAYRALGDEFDARKCFQAAARLGD